MSLEQIENRLNDACASSTRLSLIGADGLKLPAEAVYTAPGQTHWSLTTLKKQFVLNALASRHSLVMHNMTHITREVAALVASLESTFADFHVDLHIYVSPRSQATGYRVHRDSPQHKLYVQHVGVSNWTVYKGQSARTSMTCEEASTALEVDFTATLTPGSVIYMPPDTFHHVANDEGPRVSLSFPFVHDPSKRQVDRTDIPLARFFSCD